METNYLEHAIEAILFASGDAISIRRLADALDVSEEEVVTAAQALADLYQFERRGIRIIRLENSFQMCSDPLHAEAVRKVLETRKAGQLSAVLLEVLSIIAYRQPITRAYIEQVRGVDSSYSVSALVEKDLIEEAGRLDVPGRPILYRTTQNFLRVFGLSRLDELPPLPELEETEKQLSFADSAEVAED